MSITTTQRIQSVSRTFSIPTQNIDNFGMAIKRINRKAVQWNCPKVEIAYGDFEERFLDPSHPKLATVCQFVTVTGVTPQIAGWVFVATIEHLPEENVLRSVPGLTNDGELEQYRHTTSTCEHCHEMRKRNDTYIIREQSGELKQVGSTCLGAYTGSANPMKIAHLATILGMADEEGRGAEADWGSGMRGMLSLKRYLAWVALCIRLYTYVPKSKAQEWNRLATSEQALIEMEEFSKYERGDSPCSDDEERAENALAWIRKMEDAQLDSDYMRNLHAVASSSYVNYRRAGYAANIVSKYMQECEKSQQNAVGKVSAHQGKVGEVIACTVVCSEVKLNPNPGYRTWFALNTFEDALGNQYKWFAYKNTLTEGHYYQLIGVVSEHQNFHGKLSTMMKNCRTKEVTAF